MGREKSLKFDLASCDFKPNRSQKILFEALPYVSVEVITELPEVVHLAPAVATPFASGHVHQEIPVFLVVVDAGVVPVLRTGAGREAVDHALRQESGLLSNPRLGDVKLLERILLLVCPFHMFLFIGHGIPPYV